MCKQKIVTVKKFIIFVRPSFMLFQVFLIELGKIKNFIIIVTNISKNVISKSISSKQVKILSKM